MKTQNIIRTMCLVGMIPSVAIAGYSFNPAFLADDPAAVADLSHFSSEHGELPGSYRVDVYLNNVFVNTRDVKFKANVQNKSSSPTGKHKVDSRLGKQSALYACLSVKELSDLGVNVDAFSVLKKVSHGECVSLADVIPDASARLDFKQLRLDLSIPQAALKNNARGYISPEQWDQGINALLLNYNFNGNNSWGNSSVRSSDFLNLQSGINIGSWRLRDNSSWSYNQYDNSGSQERWRHISTYVQRTIIPLKSELTGGDTNTSGDIFDSIGVRGIQLASDDNMLPDSMKGFAPTVRGIAQSNAKVTIKQNGYVIYQTYVPPGAFTINDLFPTSSSGDLQVTITEANGGSSSYTVPYSAVPMLQREGRVKFALATGEYRSGNSSQDDPQVAQGTLIWGLPGGYTLYGGAQFTDNYSSYAAGFGKNMGNWGAVSLDITQANSTLADNSQHEGQSLRFLYAKSLNEWGTNFQLLGYRYSTEGYYTLSETTYRVMSGYNTDPTDDIPDGETEPNYADYYNLYYTKKGKAQISVSQQLGDFGSLFLSGSQQSYWHTNEIDTLFQVGYNGSFKEVNYNLAYNYNKAAAQPDADQIFSLNLSLPIGQWLSPNRSGVGLQSALHSAYATYSNNTDSHGHMTQMGGLSGTLLESNNLNYSISQGYSNHGGDASGNANLNYRGGYGNASLGYNYSDGGQQVNYGVAGGVVLHRNGITLSQPLGDTNVLIAAPGADNVNIENNTGVKTDWRGYALVPYANTYRQNRIALDTETLNDHTDLDGAVVNVVPTKGALVRANFTARVGVRALITIQHNGKPLPFGSVVSQGERTTTSIVGEDGVVYLAGLPLSGSLDATWGETANQRCKANYQLKESSMQKALNFITIDCQ